MSPSRYRWLRVALWVALALNALDLTTSSLPSFLDHLRPVPERSTVGWVVQLALLLPLLAGFGRALPCLVRGWQDLPIPIAARWLLTIWVLIAAGHVALRTENYPFSNIGMFSSAVPDAMADRTVAVRQVLLLRTPEGAEVISLLNEGSPLTARHDLGFDYKAGWLMRMHAHNSSGALAEVLRRLQASGASRPVRARVGLDLRTGKPVLRGAAQ